MTQIPIKTIQEHFTYCPDTGVVTRKSTGGTGSTHYKKEYKYFQGIPCPDGKKRNAQVHRIAWVLAHGEWPDQIDHINGDRADNRLSNLRNVSTLENNRNRALSSNNTSGHMGVIFHAGKWQAYIYLDNRQRYLGRFATKKEAIAARQGAERLLGFHPNHGRPN